MTIAVSRSTQGVFSQLPLKSVGQQGIIAKAFVTAVAQCIYTLRYTRLPFYDKHNNVPIMSH